MRRGAARASETAEAWIADLVRGVSQRLEAPKGFVETLVRGAGLREAGRAEGGPGNTIPLRGTDGREEDGVDDRTRVTLSACVGAAVGGVVGYLLFTEHGRRMREEIWTQLTSIGEDLGRLHGAADSLRATAGGGWHRLSSLVAEFLRGGSASADLADEEGAGPAPRFH